MNKKWIFAVCLFAAPAWAGPEEDAQYIVDQTLTKEVFAGAIFAQRELIISAAANDLAAQGIALAAPDRFFDIFIEEFLDEFTESMRQQTGAIYLDLLSADELAGIAEFYRTPAGQALIKATPELMMSGARLGAVAGQQAGKNAGPRVAKRLEAEGLSVTKDPSLMQKLLDTLR